MVQVLYLLQVLDGAFRLFQSLPENLLFGRDLRLLTLQGSDVRLQPVVTKTHKQEKIFCQEKCAMSGAL